MTLFLVGDAHIRGHHSPRDDNDLCSAKAQQPNETPRLGEVVDNNGQVIKTLDQARPCSLALNL
jgi:hypothetical protein